MKSINLCGQVKDLSPQNGYNNTGAPPSIDALNGVDITDAKSSRYARVLMSRFW
jgi:hypothetical protein